MNVSMNASGTLFQAMIVKRPVYAGLAGLKNGDLLVAAEAAGFDVFVTVDQGIEYQQNITGRNIAIILLRVKSNRIPELFRLSGLPRACRTVRPGQIRQAVNRRFH